MCMALLVGILTSYIQRRRRNDSHPTRYHMSGARRLHIIDLVAKQQY